MLKAAVAKNSVVYPESRKCCVKRHAVVILFVTGLLFIVAGFVCAITEVFKNWVKHEIKKGVVLKPGKEAYRKWHHPETPVYVTYYMFNVTNAKEVTAGEIPNLQQLGPYTYRKIREKEVLDRNNFTSSSITYLLKTYYVYDKDSSCKSCDPKRDKMTNINLPFLTVTETILRFVQSNFSYALPFVKAVMDETFKKVGLKAFQTLTVDELLWGHVDPDLTKAHDILMKLAKSRDPTIDLKLPERFSLQKNGTVAMFAIDSGEKDVDRVGKYLQWNGKAKVECWSDQYANMINGTDGTRFKPFISKDDGIYVLVTSVFRSFKLVYDSTIHVRGIRLYRFALEPKQFITGDIDGDNKGFCVTGKEKKCLPTGLMDLSSCQSAHAPIVVSLPHFYLGDPSLLKTVKGLEPHKYIHGTFIDIEPHAGISMQGQERIQINVAVRKIDGITAFKNCPNVYLPLLYVDKHGRITKEDADDFKDDVLLPWKLAEAAPFILIGIGVVLAFMAACIWYRRHRKDTRKVHDTPEEKIPLFIKSSKVNQNTYGSQEA